MLKTKNKANTPLEKPIFLFRMMLSLSRLILSLSLKIDGKKNASDFRSTHSLYNDRESKIVERKILH